MPSTKEWLSRPENQEKMRLSRLKYRLKNPDAEKVRVAAKNKRFKNLNPDYHKDKSLKEKYGISYAQYKEMHIAQNGVCPICTKEYPLESKIFTDILNVDHDHTTGKVRGLLCHKCNKALGLLADNCTSLANAIKYLGE